MPHLPLAGRHQPFRIDIGFLVDVCGFASFCMGSSSGLIASGGAVVQPPGPANRDLSLLAGCESDDVAAECGNDNRSWDDRKVRREHGDDIRHIVSL
jgi:hypothetical protein